jgi:hypothetical protein
MSAFMLRPLSQRRCCARAVVMAVDDRSRIDGCVTRTANMPHRRFRQAAFVRTIHNIAFTKV